MIPKNAVILTFFKKLQTHKLIILMLTIFLVLSSSKLSAAKEINPHASLKNFTGHLDQRIPALMKHYDIPGVNIALIQRGKITWSKAYGYADLKEGRKMTTDTYCRVESISKSVTAWGVMKLAERGKIELDKPVNLYLKHWRFPKSKFQEENVTVRQLLSHSAGMPLGTIGVRYSPKGDIPSLEESLSKDAILKQEPGLSFSYSNTGFNLLELLIEEVTGRDFAQYMAEEVLIPLQMYNSSFTWNEKLTPEVPFGYDLKGNPIPVYIYPDKAAGGLFATVEDIAKFAVAGMANFAHLDNEILNVPSIDELYTPVVDIPGYYGLVYDSYGLGHFIERLPDGKKAVSHGGQGSGWMTQFYSVPETGDGIVILTNSQRSWPFFGHILTDWAQWSGFSSIGMGLIVRMTKVLWTFIGIILIILLWQVWRLVKGVISGGRRFTLRTGKSQFLRLIQSGLSIILLLSLWWAINQDYLFISSVFPGATGWLGFTIQFSAIVLLLSALFPCVVNKTRIKG